jgi:hypothetical protein
MRRSRLLAGLLLLLAVAPLLVLAQGRGRNRPPSELPPNARYDGRFTYARIRYSQSGGEFGGRFDIKWIHDYPRSDRHFPKIVEELTTIRVRTDSSVILTLDDPDLMKFPFVYLCEAGYWLPSDAEVAGLRNYLLKGGFVIFDDFEGNQWFNFENQMRKVLPEARVLPITTKHPIFDSFYRIESLEYNHPVYGMPASFFAIYEDNDPAKRVMAIINYNNDISEYWEFSDEGLYPIDLTNEAYKIGVNYIIYAFSH